MTTEPPVYDLHDHPGLKFYRSALKALEEVGIPYVVGGAYAYSHYASIARETKDFDIFIRQTDWSRAAWARARSRSYRRMRRRRSRVPRAPMRWSARTARGRRRRSR